MLSDQEDYLEAEARMNARIIKNLDQLVDNAIYLGDSTLDLDVVESVLTGRCTIEDIRPPEEIIEEYESSCPIDLGSLSDGVIVIQMNKAGAQSAETLHNILKKALGE